MPAPEIDREKLRAFVHKLRKGDHLLLLDRAIDLLLPAWLKSLAATADPEDFATKVVLEMDHHVRYDRDRYIEIARKAATAVQR